MLENLKPKPTQLRQGIENFKEDMSLLKNGQLDWRSFVSGWTKQEHPVMLEIRSANGKIKARRYSHNLRTTVGTNWQAFALGAGVDGATTTATASSATSVTTGLTTSSTTQYNGQIIVGQPTSGNLVYGIITSCTNGAASQINVDQWYNANTPSGAAGSTPTTTSNLVILQGQAPAVYMALTSTNITPAAADTTLTGEQTTNGLSRAYATFANTSSTNTGHYTLSHTWTYTGSTSVTLYGGGVFTALTNGVLFLDNTFTGAATATVSSNGDQVSLTWTVNF